MYDYIPFVLIVGSLAVLLRLIIRKYPQLTLIDVDGIPQVREEKKKDEFLRKRVEKKANEDKTKSKAHVDKYLKMFKQWQLHFREYVGKIERTVLKKHEEKQEKEPEEKKIKRAEKTESLVVMGQRAMERHALDDAENNFIEAIRLNAKDKAAYYGLVCVYIKQGQLDEAEQTGKYLLSIDKDNDQAYVRMAEVAEQKGNVGKAIEYLQHAVLISDIFPQRFDKLAYLLKEAGENESAMEAATQALELEPENPKYLDNLLDLAIMVSNKVLAEETFAKLRMVNPDNAKLGAFKQRLEELA